MRSRKKHLGKAGEDQACLHLEEEKGYIILERNYSCLLGELDIVADDGGEIVFVEVRSCHSANLEMVENSIDRKKQKKLQQVASYYLQEKRFINHPCRFDAVIVTFMKTVKGTKVEAIRHLENIVITGF